METSEKLTLSVPEAGKALGISRAQAYLMAKTGQIPVIKLGRRIVVPKVALERMLLTPFVKEGEQKRATGLGKARAPSGATGSLVAFAEVISAAMDGSAEEFAQRLVEAARQGDEVARLLMGVLPVVSWDPLLAFLKPHLESRGHSKYLKKLIDNKEWVEEALIRIRKLAALNGPTFN